jgi:hypothetical protein
MKGSTALSLIARSARVSDCTSTLSAGQHSSASMRLDQIAWFKFNCWK